MSISTYLAVVALDKKIVVIEEIKNILPQLRRVGVNLNQLAVLCHQGRITCPDLTSVEKELSGIWRLLTSLTDKTKR
ncbi:MAG: MobC family plasmid mobilization relaxosome protein [Clostridiales bacterium]|nr:MobC family plasmid mobilization relaxosome protein [Clostridiales bacterium]